MKSSRVTITQVARAAGVSPTTVSFAFNNPDELGADTVKRILDVAHQLGYSPNPIARAMISHQTGVIGILVPFNIAASFANPFIASFMEGVGTVCDECSLSALIVSPYEGSLDKAIQRAPVDGYIVLGLDEKHAEIEPLRRRGIPFVIVDGDAENVSEVNIDDAGGAYAAAAYLLAKGHRDILFVTFQHPGPSHQDNVYYGVGGRRLKGYQRAFAENGLQLNFDWIFQSLTSIEGGAEAFQRAWDAGFRPSAVLALSDAMALGAIKQAQKLGLRVPEDLEVIGFDDIPLAELTSPALSTVNQPMVEKGKTAGLLVSTLNGNRTAERVLLPTRLVLRASTRSQDHTS